MTTNSNSAAVSVEDRFQSQVDDILDGKSVTFDAVFQQQIHQMSPDQLVANFSMLQFLEKWLKQRHDSFRDALLELVETKGRPDKGKKSMSMDVNGTKITREARVSKAPDEAQLKELLTELGIPHSDAFDQVIKVVLNESKLDSLVERGLLRQQRIDDLKKTSAALRLKSSKELHAILDRIATQFGVGVES